MDRFSELRFLAYLLTYLQPYCPAGGLWLSTNLREGVLPCAKVSISSQVLPNSANSEVSLHLDAYLQRCLIQYSKNQMIIISHKKILVIKVQ